MPEEENGTLKEARQNARILKTVMRLGHEAFDRGDLQGAADHILNNSRSILGYDRACIVKITDKRPKVLAITGQSEVKHNSEYCIQMSHLVKGMRHFNTVAKLDEETVNKNALDDAAKNAYKYFGDNGETIYLVPLIQPGKTGEETPEKYFWVIEFYNEITELSDRIIRLLSLQYRESLWFFRLTHKSLISKIFPHKKYFTPGRVIIYLFLIFIGICFFEISQNVVADFKLIPHEEAVEYAPYSGIIKKANFQNGEIVQEGDTILEYNTKEHTYNLMQAQAAYDEISARLEWIKQKSFEEEKRRGQVRILALKRKNKTIEIKKNRWYLKNSKIKADTSGTLVLTESEKWVGKAVKKGDKLFEIVPPNKIRAEVMLNEKDASILGKDTEITMYLHAKPGTPVSGEIVSISPKPMRTDVGKFAYVIEMKLDKIKPDYKVGMRGVARVKGKEVTIGYYLFKNTLLWWRKM